jgi:hypothetical protein
MEIAALVVHHHLGAMAGEGQRVRSAEAPAGSRDDCDPAVQISGAHSDWAPHPVLLWIFASLEIFHYVGPERLVPSSLDRRGSGAEIGVSHAEQ